MRKFMNSFNRLLMLMLLAGLVCILSSTTVFAADEAAPEAPTASMLKAQLFRAVQGFGGVTAVQKLIDQGVDVNAKDNYGRSALAKAVEKNRPQIVNALLKAGADINARDELGVTAIMTASVNNNSDMVELLMTSGAEFSKEDEEIVNKEKAEREEKMERQKRLRDAKAMADKLKEDLRKQEAAIAAEQAERAKKIEESNKK